MWETFEEELWARFEPPKGVDFDEALSKRQQVASLRLLERIRKAREPSPRLVSMSPHWDFHGRT